MNANPKIARPTAAAVCPIIQSLGKTGAIPHSEALACVAILRAAATPAKTKDEAPRPVSGMLTTAQVADRLQCSRKTVLRMADDGTLARHFLRPGKAKSLRFSDAEVSALFDARPEVVEG